MTPSLITPSVTAPSPGKHSASTDAETPYPPTTATVLPLGNLLTQPGIPASRRSALGPHFSLLSDALLVHLLDTLVSSVTSESVCTESDPTASAAVVETLSTLCNLSATCAHFHALATDDDLWRRIAFDLYVPTTLANSYAHSWRVTVHTLHAQRHPTFSRIRPVSHDPPPVYSDVLFHKQRCRTTTIPAHWLRHDDLPRHSATTLTASAFRTMYDRPRKPVILTDLVTKWPAYHLWTPSYLADTIPPAVVLNASGFRFSFRDYLKYAARTHASDDQTLYLFDPTIFDRVPTLRDHFTHPHPLPDDDLLSLLGSEQRPHFRWLIAGPARTGSSFHIDPNATSAWNAAIQGRKKWIFFPPGVTPPGVQPSSDGASVIAPVSVVEWFVNFYDRHGIERLGGLEALVQPGEIVFVPRGWWHCVINVDEFTIAITQNFVSETNVDAVVRWLRRNPLQISGCASSGQAHRLSREFPRLVVEKYPHLHKQLSFALTTDNVPNTSGCGDGSNVTNNEGDDLEDKCSASTGDCQSVDVPIQKKRKQRTSLWQLLQASTKTATASSPSSTPQPSHETAPKAKSFAFGF